MKFSMRFLLPFLIVIFASPRTDSQTPKTSSPNTVTPSACAARVKAAHDAGYADGVKFSDDACSTKVKDAQSKSFADNFIIGYNAASIALNVKDGKIPIQLVIEDIDGADSYRLSAAELITTYFSQHYTVSPDSNLFLYVSGTGGGTGRAFSWEVSMRIYARPQVKIGDNYTVVAGNLELSSKGGYFLNYSSSERNQGIKEAIYSVLTEGDAKLFPPAK
jgi:hypothetical protein